jgi:hypothetical protein
MLGLPFETICGRPIDLKSVDGLIVAFAPFASKLWKHMTIFLWLAVSI